PDTVVELNSDFINNVSATGGSGFSWTGVPTLDDLQIGNHLGGLIDMSVFPGTNRVVLMDAKSGEEPDQGADFNVINVVSGFTFDFQSTDQNGLNVQFLAANGAQNQLNVIYGDLVDENSTGTFFAGNFDKVFIDIEVSSPGDTFYQTR